MRASIYNAMPIEGVEALVEFMEEFRVPARLSAARHGTQYRIAVYNAISARGLERFPAAHYIVGKALADARRDPAALARPAGLRDAPQR